MSSQIHVFVKERGLAIRFVIIMNENENTYSIYILIGYKYKILWVKNTNTEEKLLSTGDEGKQLSSKLTPPVNKRNSE